MNTRALELLEWYDDNARSMPWRVSPADKKAGVRPDPYRVWLSEVMLQQTTVTTVKDYFLNFTRLWPTVSDLAAAEDADVMAAWAGLGYYARARNLLKCARTIIADHNGIFPDTREGLLSLPGIGPYTAGAISAIVYDLPVPVMDGNVERVMSRLHAIEEPLPASKAKLYELTTAHTPHMRPGDYAQATMDLGATICSPKNPACGICPWRTPCKARELGNAGDLPRKLPKKPKPTRRGFSYVARRGDGAWLLETRPEKGLLGGMLGWPGSDWSDTPEPHAPFPADWQNTGIEVRHTFTHFHLILTVFTAQAPDQTAGDFYEKLRPRDLPTVMRKVYDVAKDQLSKD
ncbi:MAG: A/G-specific adenine glycosylase [Litoreibacter sp.]